MDRKATKRAVQKFDKVVATLCPFCGVGCQTAVAVKDNRIVQVDGRNGYANENRLCVKGRFGFELVASPDRLTKPLIRRDDVRGTWTAPRSTAERFDIFREAAWEEALTRAAKGLKKLSTSAAERRCRASVRRRAPTGRRTCSRSSCVRASSEQRRSLHAAVQRVVGRGTDGRYRLRAVSAPFNRGDGCQCIVVIGARPTMNHPVAATQTGRETRSKLIVIDPRGQDLMRHATHGLRSKPVATSRC